MRVVGAKCFLFVFCLAAACVAFGQHPNDSFANRTLVSGELVTIVGDLSAATAEPNEPQLNRSPAWRGTKQSLWWTWRAPGRGTVELRASASVVFDKAIAVFRGSELGSLTNIRAAYEDAPLVFSTEGDTDYELGILTDSSQSGGFILFLKFSPAPSNDEFANRIFLGSEKQFVFDGTLKGASPGFVNGQINHGIRDVWYEWVAPVGGRLRFQFMGANNWPLQLSLFSGEDVSSLSPIDARLVQAGEKVVVRVQSSGLPIDFVIAGSCDTSQLSVSPTIAKHPQDVVVRLAADPDYGMPKIVFPTDSGRLTNIVDLPDGRSYQAPPPGTYQLTLRAEYATDSVDYNFNFKVLSGNDHFADAYSVPPEGGTTAVVSTFSATRESGEANPEASLWWKWQPNKTGHARITMPWPFALYEGVELQSLQKVTGFRGGSVFPVTAGRNYRLAVLGNRFPEAGSFEINFEPVPPNDYRHHAQVIPLSGVIAAETTGASAEVGEPGTGTATLWYRLRSPSKGLLRITDFPLTTLLSSSQLFGARIALFRGPTLTPLPLTLSSGFGLPDYYSATIEAGDDLFLQVSDRGATLGHFLLILAFTEISQNDTYERRKRIDSIPFTYRGVAGYRWWEWTASQSGTVSATAVIEQEFPTEATVKVFQGENRNSLRLISTNRSRSAVFNATAGETYVIQPQGSTMAPMTFHVSGKATNDHLKDAIALPAARASVAATLLNATLEPDEEDNYLGRAVTGSLWWKWTAPATGYIRSPLFGNFPLFRYSSVATRDMVLHTLRTARPYDWRTYQYAPVEAGEHYYLRMQTALPTEEFLYGGRFEYSFTTFRPTVLTPGDLDQGSDLLLAVPRVDEEFDGRLIPGAVFTISDAILGARTIVVSNTPTTVRFSNLEPGGYTLTAAAVNERGDILQPLSGTFSVRATNDSFVYRRNVGDYWAARMEGTTLEEGEASIMPPSTAGSLWFKWLAPRSENVLIAGMGGKDTCAVFSGSSVESLKAVAPAGNIVRFNAEAGVEYAIAVLRPSADRDLGRWFRYNIHHPNTNDSFAERTIVDAFERIKLSASSFLGSVEDDEVREPEDVTSNWWSVPVKSDGWLRLQGDLKGWSLFSGESLSTLTATPMRLVNSSMGEFRVHAGEQYSLRWATTNATGQATSVELSFSSAASADSFTDAGDLSEGERLTIDMRGMTLEAGEKTPANGATGSVWYKWRARVTGPLTITMYQEGSTVPSRKAELFSGNNLSTLQSLNGTERAVSHAAESSRIAKLFTWHVQAGTEYFIRLSSSGGSIDCDLRQPAVWPIPNDDFTSRTLLNGKSVSVTGDMTGATRDPAHAVQADSLWWSWTPPESGIALINYSPATGLAAFRGNEIAALRQVSPGRAAVEVTAGEEIILAVFRYADPDFEFQLELIDAAVNPSAGAALLLPFGQKSVFANFRGVPGRLTHLGGLDEDRHLYWTWSAPVAGTLSIRWDHPRSGVYVSPPGPIVAGRRYLIRTWGYSNDWFYFDFEPSEWRSEMQLSADRRSASLHLRGSRAGVLKVESSADLLNWDVWDYLSPERGHIQLDHVFSDEHPWKFFRATPIQ